MPDRTDPLTGIIDLLRCPATGSSLSLEEGELRSRDGNSQYNVIDGIPVLIDPSSSVFGGLVPSAGADTPGPRKGIARILARLIPSPTLNVNSAANYERLASLIVQRSNGNVRVLVVGGAIAGDGFEALQNVEGLDLVETDLVIGPRTQIVCDAHRLPFSSGSFDGVVCQAVLEHVLDPPTVVAEMHRILKPAGLIYSEIPFMQQVHAGAYDFTRYTLSGHRRLMRMFDEIDSGACCGPGSALVWSIAHFGRAVGGRSRPARELLAAIATIMTFWLKYFDRRLINRPGALDAASATYFIGRRAETAINDRQVIDGYRGGGRASAI